MAPLAVQPANSNPLNLQGGTPTVPAVPSVQPANQQQPAATGNILQPAGPTTIPAPQQQTIQQKTDPGITAQQPQQQPTTQQQSPAQTFSFGNGTTFDVNGNPVQSNNANDQIATAAGQAGLSVNDYLSLIGSQTATSAATKASIEANLGIPAASTAAFALPAQSTVSFYNDAYNQSGLADLKQQILDLNNNIAQTTQQYNEAVGTENENPFLSEAARVGRTSNLYNTAQATIANLVNQQNNLQGIYANGVNEVNNAVTRYTNDFTTNTQQNQAKLTYLMQQAEAQETAQQNTDTAAMVARYAPEFAQSSAIAKTPATVTAPNGETLSYNKQTGKFEELTPPVGSYSAYANPITGQTGVLNQQTGAIGNGATPGQGAPTLGTPNPDSGAPTIQIPQYSSSNTTQSQLAYVNNNPGNLQYAGQAGATQGAGGFAKFATPQAGYQALVAQVGLDASRGLTLGQYITKYAPPSSNNTAQYIAQATAALGASADTALNQIDPNAVASFQAQKESGSTVQAPVAPAGAQPLTVQNAPSGQGTIDQQAVAQVQTAFQNVASSLPTDQRTYSQYTLNGYLQKGDLQGAAAYVKNLAVKSLSPTEQDNYNQVGNAVSSLTQAATILSQNPNLNLGPYEAILQSSKPWLGQTPDPTYTGFLQNLTAATTLIMNSDFGSRLTPYEISTAQQFLPTKNDPPTTVMNKIQGAIGLFNYENDKVISQQTGEPLNPLSSYLTAAGFTGQ